MSISAKPRTNRLIAYEALSCVKTRRPLRMQYQFTIQKYPTLAEFYFGHVVVSCFSGGLRHLYLGRDLRCITAPSERHTRGSGCPQQLDISLGD